MLKKLEKIDESLNLKLEEASNTLNKNKNESLKEINDQIYNITKLALSKVSNIQTNDTEIKEAVEIVKTRAIN